MHASNNLDLLLSILTKGGGSTAWMKRGLCTRFEDPEQFFPERGHQPHPHVHALCESCPVREMCRDWAIEHNETGWWGNTNDKQRDKIRQSRRDAA